MLSGPHPVPPAELDKVHYVENEGEPCHQALVQEAGGMRWSEVRHPGMTSPTPHLVEDTHYCQLTGADGDLGWVTYDPDLHARTWHYPKSCHMGIE